MLCSKRGKISGPDRKTHSSILVANNPVQHQRTPFANFRNRSHLAIRKTHQTCSAIGMMRKGTTFFARVVPWHFPGVTQPKMMIMFCEDLRESYHTVFQKRHASCRTSQNVDTLFGHIFHEESHCHLSQKNGPFLHLVLDRTSILEAVACPHSNLQVHMSGCIDGLGVTMLC